jgi:hypothetical protein
VSDTESALQALSEQLEKYCKDQPQSVTVGVLKAAQATLEVLAEHPAADPAEMALTIKAAICLHRPGRRLERDSEPKQKALRKQCAAASLA